jgi:hypothetical protein
VAVAGDPASVRTAAAGDSGIREALAPLAAPEPAAATDPLPARALGRALARSTRVVVSSRPGSPYAAALTRSTGRPFSALAPADRPRWYQPPGDWSVGGGRRPANGRKR